MYAKITCGRTDFLIGFDDLGVLTEELPGYTFPSLILPSKAAAIYLVI